MAPTGVLRAAVKDAAGKVADVAQQSAWDVAFPAVDPERERTISFSAPYAEIGGTYAVRKDSRVAPDTFMTIGQASGFVAAALKRSGSDDATVAPPAR